MFHTVVSYGLAKRIIFAYYVYSTVSRLSKSDALTPDSLIGWLSDPSVVAGSWAPLSESENMSENVSDLSS